MSKRAIYMGGKRTSVASVPIFTYDEVAADDWGVDEGVAGSPTLTSAPAAGDGNIGVQDMVGYITYAMTFSLDVAASATLTSATLEVKTSSDSATSASWFLKIQDGTNTTEPLNAAAATTAVDRCGSGWTAAGATPSAVSTTYAIDVKTEIETVIARDGWSSGNNITLFLSGPVVPAMGSCTGSGSDDSDVETVASSSGTPNLTVVYT